MVKPILVTGAAGRVGAVGRTVTELLLRQGKAVRAMVRTEDERAQALRDKGAEVVVGDLLDLDSMQRVIAGCETMYFGTSVSDSYLAATVNTAAVAKYHGVKAFINMSQMTVSQMSITETTASPKPGGGLHELYQATTDDPLITAYVTRRPDRLWAVLLINKDPDNAREVKIEFHCEELGCEDFKVGYSHGEVDFYQYSRNEYQLGADFRVVRDRPPVHELLRVGSSTTFKLPAYSLSVVRG